MATRLAELQTAMDAEITPKVLDILVEIAKEAVYHDDKDTAAEILALALQYPMRVETYAEAEGMFTALETELCPRVIHDAWEQAQRMTLEDMVAHILAHATEE
jgi:hypothetical protein